MERLKQTLYDVLGVSRDAKNTDVGRAYNRLRAEMRSETAAPDPRREALLHEAYEVLSDPQKRAAYDLSLRRGFAYRKKEGRSMGPALTVAVLVLGAIGVIAALYIMNRPSVTGAAAKSPAEIQTAASLAVSRLQSVDLSGKATSMGIAFTVDEGVMTTPCAGLTPTAQLIVLVPPRSVPARIVAFDPRGFCKLAVEGGGSWPLKLSSVPPRAGQKVYAANVATNGEVALREGTVSKLVQGADGPIVETNIPVLEGMSGRPLLDIEGRVVAIAMLDDSGKGRHVTVPESLLRAATAAAPSRSGAASAPGAPTAAPPSPSTPPASEADDGKSKSDGQPRPPPPMPGGREVTPERREALEKAFRPPPQVPGDL